MTAENATRAADGMYSSVNFLLDYIEKRVDPSLEMLIGRKTAREEYMLGLYYLTKAWLISLKKLNEPKDIQAIMTANRSLMEMTVDLIHLYRDGSRATVQRMRQFDRFQKFRVARAAIMYFEKTKVRPPAEYSDMESFYRKKKSVIERKRDQLWPGKKSPLRWSGNDLLADVRGADGLLPHQIKLELGSSLEEFYETEYRRLNWYVHGSGMSGFWNLSANVLTLICAMGFWSSACLAMLCIQVILAEFHFTKVSDLDDEWARLKAARSVAFLDLNPHLHDAGTPAAIEGAKQALGWQERKPPEPANIKNK